MKSSRGRPEHQDASDPAAVTQFSFGLVYSVLARIQRGESVARAVTEVVGITYPDHRSLLRYVSKATLRCWLQTFLAQERRLSQAKGGRV